MIVVGTKLGGNARGGNSLNVAANAKTSSSSVEATDVIDLPVPVGVRRDVGRSNGS